MNHLFFALLSSVSLVLLLLNKYFTKKVTILKQNKQYTKDFENYIELIALSALTLSLISFSYNWFSVIRTLRYTSK